MQKLRQGKTLAIPQSLLLFLPYSVVCGKLTVPRWPPPNATMVPLTTWCELSYDSCRILKNHKSVTAVFTLLIVFEFHSDRWKFRECLPRHYPFRNKLEIKLSCDILDILQNSLGRFLGEWFIDRAYVDSVANIACGYPGAPSHTVRSL